MKEINELEESFEKIKKLDVETNFEQVYKFIQDLSSNNQIEYIQFHYELLKDKEVRDIYYDVRVAFKKRPKEIIEPFLLEKLESEQDISLRADVIQLLGGYKVIKSFTLC